MCSHQSIRQADHGAGGYEVPVLTDAEWGTGGYSPSPSSFSSLLLVSPWAWSPNAQLCRASLEGHTTPDRKVKHASGGFISRDIIYCLSFRASKSRKVAPLFAAVLFCCHVGDNLLFCLNFAAGRGQIWRGLSSSSTGSGWSLCKSRDRLSWTRVQTHAQLFGSASSPPPWADRKWHLISIKALGIHWIFFPS